MHGWVTEYVCTQTGTPSAYMSYTAHISNVGMNCELTQEKSTFIKIHVFPKIQKHVTYM